MTNLTTPGNMTNLTSGFGNMTNLTSASGNMTSPAAPVSKLEALIDLMNQNMTYINIHTSQFPEGELRGTSNQRIQRVKRALIIIFSNPIEYRLTLVQQNKRI